ncbi:MAG: lysophospholipid acyltransferase family protein [Pirellulaceae bacterium]|nr:lysophospholipid acyltransferase family protein [Pirellulaceae bacterium]
MSHPRHQLINATELPRVDSWLMHGFERHFLPRYLRRHFHVVAANHQALSPAITQGGSSMVVYANHASWWDPMIAIYLRARLMPNHCMYAPIDAAALDRYRIFKRMGFYGIALGSHRGAVEFLKRSLRVAQSPRASLWLTPEGKFCDSRQLSQPFLPGMAHLASAIGNTNTHEVHGSHSVWFVPAAIEYTFWEERLPECLCWFGTPVEVHWNQPQSQSKEDWNQLFMQHLRDAQRQLSAASIARDTARFTVLLSGAAGSWGIYDAGRKALARLRGQKLSLEHSEKLWGN